MMICTESKWRKLVYTSRRRINRRLYNHNRFSLFCRIILYVQSSRTELCLWQKTSATWPRRKKQIGTGWRKPRRPSEIAVRPAPQERNSAPWASFKPSRSIHWICVQAPMRPKCHLLYGSESGIVMQLLGSLEFLVQFLLLRMISLWSVPECSLPVSAYAQLTRFFRAFIQIQRFGIQCRNYLAIWR